MPPSESSAEDIPHEKEDIELDCWVLEWTTKPSDADGDPHWKVAGVYLTIDAVEDAEDDLRDRLEDVRTRHGSRRSPTTLHVPHDHDATWSVPVFSLSDVFDVYSRLRQEALEETDGFRAGMEHGASEMKERLFELTRSETDSEGNDGE